MCVVFCGGWLDIYSRLRVEGNGDRHAVNTKNWETKKKAPVKLVTLVFLV